MKNSAPPPVSSHYLHSPGLRECKSSERHKQTYSMPEFVSPPKGRIIYTTVSWKKDMI